MIFLDHFRSANAPDRGLLRREVCGHMQQWFGAAETTLHPLSEAFIEIRSREPSEQFPFRVVHTVGMASKAMKTRRGQEPFAELMMVLPSEWSYGTDADWPMREMKRFAGMFHEMSACLTEFISIPASTHPSSIPGTPFCGLMAVRPQFVPPAAHKVELSSGQIVHLYVLMPLHFSEMKFLSMQTDPEALWCVARTERRDALELCVVDPRRPPVA